MSQKTEVATIGDRGHVVVTDDGPTIANLLDKALEKGAPVETMEKLAGLMERFANRQARQEFNDALREFQSQVPSIKRTSTARITPKQGTPFSYKYAELDEIADAIREPLHQHGLSYTWDSDVEETKLTCICIVRHLGGHEERTNFALPIDSAAGMSPQQKVAAALTFAKRQSLTAALGLTMTDPDTDGGDQNPAKITELQAQELEQLMEQVGMDAPARANMLRWQKVEKVPDILAVNYASVANNVSRWKPTAQRRPK